MIDAKQVELRSKREIEVIYKHLLSGDRTRIKAGRRSIEALRRSGLLIIALDVVDKVKRWINQDQKDPDSKKIAFLHGIWKDAKEPGNSLPKKDRWKYKGQTARALLYAGAPKKARIRFDKAVRNIPGGLTAADKIVRNDIFAAHAEAEIYCGRVSQAIGILDQILVAERKAWHQWVRAFAFHQRGFLQRVPFGMAVDEDDTMPGPPPDGQLSWYVRSNNLLAAIQKQLSKSERLDSQLLVAANFGALYRISQSASDKQEAVDALEAFRKAASPSSNRTWSWKKERRGRFPAKVFDDDEGNHSEAARVTWRKAYRGHYRDNLRECGLLANSAENDDGDTDDNEDNGDDNGE